MKKNAYKKWAIYLLTFFVIIFFTEVILKKAYGFTEAILFRADSSFEYIPVPQSRYRFRKNNYYNHFSQRSREITPADSNIVLGFGDSVLNGGAQTDQDSLATSLLTQYLSTKYQNNTLVANVSAGSWGPDNCYGYLKKYGNFQAKQILLVVSSHDAYDTMQFDSIVGIHPNYPRKQYASALMEVLARYVYPRYIQSLFTEATVESKDKNNDLLINKYTSAATFNSGFESFKNYTAASKIPLVIYLHADKSELANSAYNRQGKEIIDFCLKNNIKLIKELDYKFHEADYRDDIHLSERGQRHMYLVLRNYF